MRPSALGVGVFAGGLRELFRHVGEAGRMKTWLPSLPMKPQGERCREVMGDRKGCSHVPQELTFKGATGEGGEGVQAATRRTSQAEVGSPQNFQLGNCLDLLRNVGGGWAAWSYFCGLHPPFPSPPHKARTGTISAATWSSGVKRLCLAQSRGGCGPSRKEPNSKGAHRSVGSTVPSSPNHLF